MLLKRVSSNFSGILEVFLYCNRFQLATTDALYSDGDKYIPAVTAVNALKTSLPRIHKVLVLGAGLGSMAQILQKKGFNPDITLVDIDGTILNLAMELSAGRNGKITPICSDAMLFMTQNATQYDLIFIDVFNGRIVPEFVCSSSFLSMCQASLAPGGHVTFNYIVNDKSQWEQVNQLFTGIFPINNIVSISINKILIGSLS